MGGKDLEFSLQNVEFEMSMTHRSVDKWSFEERGRAFMLRMGEQADEENIRMPDNVVAQIKLVNLNFQ